MADEIAERTQAQAEAEASGAPWPEVLSSAKLKAAGLKMESLAEQVGVSAAYLRLLRQGKRSPSPETAERLFQQLGYRIQSRRKDAGADIIAKDHEGNLVVASAKSARAARTSSLERALEELLQTTKELQERVQPGESAFLEDWDTWSRAGREEPAKEASEREEKSRPPRRLPFPFADQGGWPALWSSHVPGVGAVVGKPRLINRPEVERLLRAVAEPDLPLVAAYLTLLLEREGARRRGAGRTSSPTRSAGTSEGD